MVLTPSQHPDWLHWLESCPSTNSWALSQLSQLPHGAVIFTPQQTAGRGQHGRVWQSPPGTLTASFVLHQIPVVQLPGLSLIAGLAVIVAIADCCPELSPVLGWKWPNDVLIERKKLAGILCESVTSSGKTDGSVVIGIGINRQTDFQPEEMPEVEVHDALYNRATSLHQWVVTVPDEFFILEKLRFYLLNYASLLSITDNDFQSTNALTNLLPELRKYDALLGQSITIELGGNLYSGEACGISDRGHLLLKLATGEIRPFVSGHILW